MDGLEGMSSRASCVLLGLAQASLPYALHKFRVEGLPKPQKYVK